MGEIVNHIQNNRPKDEYARKSDIYASGGNRIAMSDSEWSKGRNNTGEVETPLGSIPNAQNDNWLYAYFSIHINYIEDMLEYLAEQIENINGGTT